MKKSNVIILCVVFLVIGFTLGSFLKMVLNNNDNLNEVEEKKTVNYYENEEEKSNNMVDAEFNGKFWNYDGIEECVSTDPWLYSISDLKKNLLASLIKKYNDNQEALFDYYSFEGEEVYGDATGGISRRLSFNENEPIYFSDDQAVELKYSVWHERVYNEAYYYVFHGKEALSSIKKDLDKAIKENYENEILYYEEQLKYAEDIIERMSGDETIINMKRHCQSEEDFTIDDEAYITGTYGRGYFDNPSGERYYQVNKMCIMNGNNLDKYQYNGKGRAKKIQATINGQDFTFDLADTPECQIFDIDYKTTEITKPVTISIKVLEYYPGAGHTSDNPYTDDYKNAGYISYIGFSVGDNIFVGGR